MVKALANNRIKVDALSSQVDVHKRNKPITEWSVITAYKHDLESSHHIPPPPP